MSNIVEADYRVVPERTLPVIASEILYIESQVAKTALDGAIQIGIKLKEAKEKVDHGQWEDWCSENLNYSKSKAEKMMKIATEYGDENSPYAKTYMCTDLSISKALRLLQVPESEVESFAEKNDIQDMTVKELEDKIKALKQEKEDQSVEMEKEILELQERMEKKNDEAERLAGELAALKSQTADPDEITKLEEKLQKTKIRENELKEKLKAEKEARDQEIQKALEKEGDKLKAEAAKQIEITRRDNESMAQRVKELEAKIDNVSNESLMLFKLKVDQLQKIYQECQEAATETPDPDKTKAALLQIMDALIGQEA
ncbi:MAG: DUF3102 domain-containing protein [Clostridia bacterium]